MTIKKSLFSLLALTAGLLGCAQQNQLVGQPNDAEPKPQSVQSPISPAEIEPPITVTSAAEPVRPALTDKPAQAKPVQPADLWDEIRAGYGFPKISNRRTELQKKWYAKHPSYLRRVAKRSEPYLFYITEEIRRRGMPMEIALLPFVESAYDPFAYSHVRASGLWQFTPPTAGDFGLNETWWYDGRRDIEASTHAALDYLQQLHRRFNNDWLLALAAYNAGGGTVSKAIRNNKRRAKGSDFWSLKLPKETRIYVPRLIGLSQLLLEADKLNIAVPYIAAKPYFKRFDLDYQLDLAQAAELAEMNIDSIYLLNPGYSQWATAPEGAQHLLLPVDKSDTFTKNLAKLAPQKRIGWKRYKIKSGDSLGKIAQAHKVKVSALKTINKLNSNIIRAGHALIIPVAAKHPSHYRYSLTQRQTRKTQGGNKRRYKVRSGDSLWTIAKKFNVSYNDLARWNQLSLKSIIKPGKKLTIYRGKNQRNTLRYKVQKGDSLGKIAQRFSTSVKSLLRLNNIKNSRLIRPGQSLLVRRG